MFLARTLSIETVIPESYQTLANLDNLPSPTL